MNRFGWLGALAAVVALTAGCGIQSLAGNPVPVANEMRTKDVPATRPRELRLDGKDPCATVPKSEWARFSIDLAKPEMDQTYRSPSCFFNSSKAAMGVVLVVTEGIEAWAPGKRVSKPANVEPIQG